MPDLPDFTKPGSITLDRTLTADELAQFPAGTQALPIPEGDGWSRSHYKLQWGMPVEPFLSIASLGHNGQFGNQLFQYAFARIYADMTKRPLMTPSWAGTKLFGLKDRPIVQVYPHFRDLAWREEDSELLKNFAEVPPTLDISGYFQFHTSWYRISQHQIRQWFTPLPEIEATFRSALDAMVGDGTLVAIHLRRGDYGKGMFFIPPNSVYLDWLSQIWPTLKNPVLYIASDDLPNVLPAFAMFSPKCSADFPAIQGMEYYSDFWVMTQASRLAISNSTFSFAAAMLNDHMDYAGPRDKWTLRPVYGGTRLHAFDPWDSIVLTDRDKAEVDTTASLTGNRNVFGVAREEIVNG